MSENNLLNERRVGDVLIATIESSELTSGMADALLEKLRELMAAGQTAKLVLDLSNVKFIDSIALGSLVVLLRRVKEAQGRLALSGLTGHCRRVMEVTGLERVFQLHPDVPAATEALQSPG